MMRTETGPAGSMESTVERMSVGRTGTAPAAEVVPARRAPPATVVTSRARARRPTVALHQGVGGGVSSGGAPVPPAGASGAPAGVAAPGGGVLGRRLRR